MQIQPVHFFHKSSLHTDRMEILCDNINGEPSGNADSQRSVHKWHKSHQPRPQGTSRVLSGSASQEMTDC